jgi:hypothetical protein
MKEAVSGWRLAVSQKRIGGSHCVRQSGSPRAQAHLYEAMHFLANRQPPTANRFS